MTKASSSTMTSRSGAREPDGKQDDNGVESNEDSDEDDEIRVDDNDDSNGDA